jgi:uroporphyrin-3 C-methyltransferase
MLVIEPITEPAMTPTIDPGSVVIFISANAVRAGMPHLARQLKENAPTVIAVGEATAAALALEDITALLPATPDSEGLLALTELDNCGERPVLLVKGEGGRALLAESLRERGAIVSEFICYRRLEAPVNAAEFCWQLCDLDEVVFQGSSGETVERLTEVLGTGGQPNLLDSPLIVPSARVASMATDAGWTRVIEAENASDRGFLAALAKLSIQPAKLSSQPGAEQHPGPESAADSAVKKNFAAQTSSPVGKTEGASDAAASDGTSLSQHKTEPRVTKDTDQSSAKSPGRADWFARFLLLLMLAAIGATAYGAWRFIWPDWQRLIGQDTQVDARLQTLEATESVTQVQLDAAVSREIDQLQTRLSSAIAATSAGRAEQQAQAAAEQAALLARLDRLEIRLARLTATDRREWLVQEAAFTVRLAAQRLSSARDVKAALALLSNADRLLAEVDDSRLDRARMAVAADRVQLMAAPRVDTVGIYARFSALVTQAGALSIGRQRTSEQMDDLPAPGDGWLARARWGWEAALAKLSGYLVIKTRDHDASSLNTPTEEELTRQLIRLLLEQAQIAALSNNQLLFDKTLVRAADALRSVEAQDPDRAAPMLAELALLSAINVSPSLPDLVASSAALADALQTLESTIDQAEQAELDGQGK